MKMIMLAPGVYVNGRVLGWVLNVFNIAWYSCDQSYYYNFDNFDWYDICSYVVLSMGSLRYYHNSFIILVGNWHSGIKEMGKIMQNLTSFLLKYAKDLLFYFKVSPYDYYVVPFINRSMLWWITFDQPMMTFLRGYIVLLAEKEC